MKRWLLTLLTVCLIVGLTVPAYATESGDDPDNMTGLQEEIQPQEPTQEKQQPGEQQEPQNSPVVVSTFEELQAAVDAAEDGESIYLDCTINMEDGNTLVTDKHITLRRATGLMKTGGRMIELYGSGTISGFTFFEDCPISCSVIQTKAEGNGKIIIENCVFDVRKETNVSDYIMINADDTAKISGCTFYCGNGYVIYTQARTNVLIDTTEPEDKPKLSCGGAVIDTSRTIVLLGYGDGDPHEEDPLTRAQLAEIIYRLLDEKSIAEFDISEQVFIDVSPDSWYYQPIQIIRKAGIVTGTGGGFYSPNGLVTWAQVVTVLSRFTEPQEYTLQHIQYDGWAVEAVQTAVALGWIQDRADLNPDAVISRGELVQLVNGVLELNR